MGEKKTETEQNGKPNKVDFYIYEEDMARAERHANRWMAACIIIFAALIVSNIAWIIYENSFQDVVTTTQTVTQDTNEKGGTNNYNGDFYGGDYNGETDSK